MLIELLARLWSCKQIPNIVQSDSFSWFVEKIRLYRTIRSKIGRCSVKHFFCGWACGGFSNLLRLEHRLLFMIYRSEVQLLSPWSPSVTNKSATLSLKQVIISTQVWLSLWLALRRLGRTLQQEQLQFHHKQTWPSLEWSSPWSCWPLSSVGSCCTDTCVTVRGFTEPQVNPLQEWTQTRSTMTPSLKTRRNTSSEPFGIRRDLTNDRYAWTAADIWISSCREVYMQGVWGVNH